MKAIVIMAGGESSRMGEDKIFLRYQNSSFLEYLVRRAFAVFDRVLISAGTKEHGALIAQRLSASGSRASVPQPEIIIDRVPGLGPIGGLISVFEKTGLERFAVAAADMPDADMQVLAALLDRLKPEEAVKLRPEVENACVGSKKAEDENAHSPEAKDQGQSKAAVMLQFHPDYPEPCAAAYGRSSCPIMKAACDQGLRSIVKAIGYDHIETVTAAELKRSSPAFAELDLEYAFRNINTPDDYRSLSIR